MHQYTVKIVDQTRTQHIVYISGQSTASALHRALVKTGVRQWISATVKPNIVSEAKWKPHWITEFLLFVQEAVGFTVFWLVTAAAVVILLKGLEAALEWMA